MKIATYNVNGVNGRLPVLLRWLEENEPDVVCLQELKAPDEKFPKREIERLGYDCIWHGQKSWNGVAFLSKGYKMDEIGRGLPGDPEDVQSRYIEAVIGGIVFAGLYLPNGNPAPGPKFDYKLRWMERLQHRADELLQIDSPVILLGDFNVIPTEIDAYKPEHWIRDALYFPETRAAYQRLLDSGWNDVIRTLHPEERIYTFWEYFRNSFARNAGIRIDHFLANDAAMKMVGNCGVDTNVRGWEKTSDHAPVWIELK